MGYSLLVPVSPCVSVADRGIVWLIPMGKASPVSKVNLGSGIPRVGYEASRQAKVQCGMVAGFEVDRAQRQTLSSPYRETPRLHVVGKGSAWG